MPAAEIFEPEANDTIVKNCAILNLSVRGESFAGLRKQTYRRFPSSFVGVYQRQRYDCLSPDMRPQGSFRLNRRDAGRFELQTASLSKQEVFAMPDEIVPSNDNPRQLSFWGEQPILTSPFDAIRHYDENGEECWYARELASSLGYSKWSNFTKSISKARVALKNSELDPKSHIADASNMVDIGSGAQRKIVDYKLSRFACYHIANESDVSKPEVTAAKNYFLTQTRKQELAQAERHARAQLKHNQDVTAYQLLGKSEDWSETRVAAKEATRIQNAAIHNAHETHKPNFGEIAGKQNQALFDMSKRELVEYLGLLPKDADKYRDNLGRWTNEAVRIAGKEITRQIGRLNRELGNDETLTIVTTTSREVAKHARALADLDHVDYLSGSPIDERGNALIVRNVRLIGGGK